jgi:hypothetical protein
LNWSITKSKPFKNSRKNLAAKVNVAEDNAQANREPMVNVAEDNARTNREAAGSVAVVIAVVGVGKAGAAVKDSLASRNWNWSVASSSSRFKSPLGSEVLRIYRMKNAKG